MKKILILTVGFDGGGSGKMAALMENFLSKCYETVTVVFFRDTEIFKLKGKKINVGNLFNFSFPGLGYIELVAHIINTIKYIKQEKPHIVIGVGRYSNLLGLIAQKFLNFKLLLTQHEHITSGMEYNFKLGAYNIIYFMTKKLIGHNKIVCVSNEVKVDVIDFYGIEKKQAQTIYNGLDFDEIKKLGNEHINIQDNFIINIGRLDANKNQELLIKAYSKSNVKEKYKLLLLGEGYKKKYLIDLCKKLNIENFVIFAGFDKNPYKYLSKASLFCLTSKTEALPTVLIESLILNVPIISVPVTGVSEILNNGEFGVITKDRDESNLVGALNNFQRDQYIKLTDGRTKFLNDNFSIKVMKAKYFDIIDNL